MATAYICDHCGYEGSDPTGTPMDQILCPMCGEPVTPAAEQELGVSGSHFAVRKYVAIVLWWFATTMPPWPHEYTVKAWRPELAANFEDFPA